MEKAVSTYLTNGKKIKTLITSTKNQSETTSLTFTGNKKHISLFIKGNFLKQMFINIGLEGGLGLWIKDDIALI